MAKVNFFQIVARKIPGLPSKLRQAGLFDEPEEYIKKTVSTALLLSFGLSLVVFFFLPNIAAFLFLPIFFPLMFLYFIKYVDVKIEKLKRGIDEEIIFVGRFIVIELESGVPMHKVFEDIERNYEVVGKYFGEIIDNVYLGTGMEEAVNNTLMNTPSSNLRRILWQLLNSMKTGTEVSTALNSVIDQIVKEQDISVKEYGKKLSPLAMFYMMVSIIIPSLGITMLVIMATFIGLKMNTVVFLMLAGLIGIVQFLFLTMILSSRPAISSQ
jgi:archaeal flagellar protein FlaJ